MKLAVMVLAMLLGLYGVIRAEGQHLCVYDGGNHGIGSSGAVSSLPREQGATRDDAAGDAGRRTALEKERRRAIAMIEEVMKKARDRARREADESLNKRPAEEKQHAGREKEAAQKKGLNGGARTGGPAAKEKDPGWSAAVQ